MGTTSMPARYVRSLLQLVSSERRTDVMADLGIDPSDLDKGQPVPIEKYASLFSLMLDHAQLAIHGEEDVEPIQQFSCYRLLLESMAQSSDLEQALKRGAVCFRRLASERTGIHARVEDNRVHLVFTFPDQEPESWSIEDLSRDRLTLLPGLIGHSTLLWIWHRLISWLIGNYISLESVEFTDPVPASPEKYSKLFNSAQVNFQQRESALVFTKRYLEYPVVQTAEAVDKMLDVFLLPLFLMDQQDDSTATRIRSLLGSDFSRPFPPFDEMAKKLNVSVPTLHRRLQKEQSSYQKIKDDCRRQAAAELLLYSDLPIRMVAERLGFSDDGTFHRAFRKWTGMTPAEFRQSSAQ